MAYSEYINLGIDYLLKSQNEDGGIARACPDEDKNFPNTTKSGVWTTAESLEAILDSESLQLNISTLDNLILMADYLIDKIIYDGEYGYWEVVDNEGASTMTTGHVIFALKTFSNKILTNCDLEKITIKGKVFEIADIKSKISSITEKGLRWLQNNQQLDNGWSHTSKTQDKQSTNLCTYYVLKGYQIFGKTKQNDQSMERACLFVKEKIGKLIQSKNYQKTDLSEVLYGFTCLSSSGYFTKSENEFRKQIIKYVNKHWKKLKKYIDLRSSFFNGDSVSAYETYVDNIPYIALKAFLLAEEFTFSDRLKKLIKSLINNRNNNGEWAVYKADRKETTWVTAEAVLALNQAQQKLLKYEQNIERKRKERFLTWSSCILIVVCTVLLLVNMVPLFSSEADIWQKSFNVVATFLGIVSSMISIIGVFKK